MVRPTELTDRSTAGQYDTDELRAAVIEWYERTGQAPRRREFNRDEVSALKEALEQGD